MNARTITAFAAIGILSACNSSGGGDTVALENVSVEEAAKQARTAIKLEPGQWESAVRIVSVEMPGAPKEVADALGKSISAKVNTSSDCLTPEEAEKPAADMFAGSKSGECRYEKFARTGGKMDAVMVCKSPDAAQPGEVRMAMNGDYTPTSFALDMTMDMAGGGLPGGQGMKMRARTEGKRTGQCIKPAT